MRLWHAIERAGMPHYRDAEGRITTDAVSSGVKNKRKIPRLSDLRGVQPGDPVPSGITFTRTSASC